MLPRAALLGALTWLAACSDLVRPEDYQPIPSLAESSITPGAAYDLWELRAVGPDLIPHTIAAGGIRTRQEIDPETPLALRAFLGPIDQPSEAALVAFAEDYSWRGTVETGGVRPVADGYELVVLELVAVCAPLQVDRVVIQVNAAGEIRRLRREVWEKSNACI